MNWYNELPSALKPHTDANIASKGTIDVPSNLLEGVATNKSTEAVTHLINQEENDMKRRTFLGLPLNKVESKSVMTNSLYKSIMDNRQYFEDTLLARSFFSSEIGEENSITKEDGWIGYWNKKQHQIAEYEKMRGSAIRCIEEQLELLRVGLVALHRDPPKPHVIDDHASRAIEALTAELERLKVDFT